jgi:two-component system phosphate regulon sensor histidine kinase PhoR
MPHRRPLIWQLFPPYLVVILLSLLAVTIDSSRAVKNLFFEELSNDLSARAQLARTYFEEHPDLFLPGHDARAQDMCRRLGQNTATRVTLIRPDGSVVADSEDDPARMDNHAGRPEVVAALGQGNGASVRFSNTVRRDMMYVALPLASDGANVGVVRVAIPITPIDESLWYIYSRIALVGTIVAFGAAFVSWRVSRRIMRPLNMIKQGAERFAQGSLDQRLPIPDSAEVASLAEAMNQMAAQLSDRIRTAVQQRNEQEAVLSSMVESVIAVDRTTRIITFNQAAAHLLGVDADHIAGRQLEAVVQNEAIRGVVRQALESDAPIEGELAIEEEGGRILQAHGTTLLDAAGHAIGAVVVLNDVTRLRRLEQVRRDFVANVSHELKTPITSIKGFVETLLDGALDQPDDARRFLSIVQRQADRLSAIIEDLLTLSRIEQEEEHAESILDRGPIRGVIDAAVQLCGSAAAAKNIHLDIACEPGLEAHINAALLEQGVVNLVDNAIKYSEPDRTVRVEARGGEREILIRVIDQGSGIPAAQLPRLFERFYRVDKARSRSMGGTGLGLAIVKHIAQTHGGRVTVESEVGQGSIFTIHLPRPLYIRT